ncbi:MAG: hypothetical protein ABW202_10025 [Duganella sp.]
MNTMKWLIRRELWEHKGMLVWAPIVIAGLIAALALAATFFHGTLHYNGETITPQNLVVTIEGSTRSRIVDTMAQTFVLSALPVYLALASIVFFYCLGALNDERRDRSILFWKSLPVSDTNTVLSKALVALVVTPLIVLGVGLGLSLLLLLAVCVKLSLHGTFLFTELLLTPELYLTPLRIVSLLPVYIVWALPSVGWLLMVSSMARSKVFMWAVGIPVVAALLLLWAEKALGFSINAGWLINHLIGHLLLGVVPGGWLGFPDGAPLLEQGQNMAGMVAVFHAQGWASLAQPNIWLGAAGGVLMLAVAVWMRRRREEG